MTDREIKIKIAENLGRCHHPKEAIRSEDWEDGNDAGTDWTCTLCRKDPHYHPIPNYPESLDACVEFEKTLASEEWASYWSFLEILACRPNNTPIIFAGPLQRCLAYIKTKNL